jgi:hypothetical protein
MNTKAAEWSLTNGVRLELHHELIYPPIQEFWDAAVSGTS